MNEPKPDESRLLTTDDIKDIILQWCSPETKETDITIEPFEHEIRDKQDALTASIKDQEFEKKCLECEYDPQAAEFGWFIKQGWLPPAKVEELKAKSKQRVERIRQEIIGIDCMDDIADIQKAITSMVFALKEEGL